MVTYIFYFFTLSKGIDDGLSFLGYVLSTKPSFCLTVLFSITCTSVTGGITMNRRQLQWS